VGYLPNAKILIEADSYSPGATALATPAPNAVVLYDNLQRPKLSIDQIVPIHGRPVPYADFLKAVAKG
jgi:hypothetical protein